jgi:phospho-N-acetylmuramoyl-pentapeptide-transferase
MLYHLILQFAEWFSALNVLKYITFRAVLAFMIAFILCLFLFPKFIKFLTKWKANQIIREEGPKSHNKKIGTPTMGGFLVVLILLFTNLICANFNNLYILIILFATIAFAIIGFIDDYLKISRKTSDGMHAKFKLISQLLVAFFISISLYYILGKDFAYITIPFFKNVKIHLGSLYLPVPFFQSVQLNIGGLLYILFGVFIIVSASNAVNITDGLDGLAGGLLIAATVTLGGLSYLSGHEKFANYLLIDFLPLSGELLVYTFALIGGLCAFLWYNSHPAQIFMGDTGSICFGGIVGTIALMIKQELLLAIIGGVFVAETLSVIIQVTSYKLRKKRIFLMAPLHHHFELKGWPESKIIARFWIIGGICAVIALGSLKLR